MFLGLGRSLISPKLCMTEKEFTKFSPEGQPKYLQIFCLVHEACKKVLTFDSNKLFFTSMNDLKELLYVPHLKIC